jgi:hypothetical protein
VSLFGVEHTTSTRSAAPQPLRYLFDITGHVQGAGSDVKVDLLPIEGLTQPSRGAAAAPAVRVGTVAVHAT